MSNDNSALQKFRQDAARWVIPSKHADPSTLTWGQILRLLHRHMPLRAMAWYRFACWCKLRRIPFVYGQILRHLLTRFGLELGGEIGGGLYIAHPVGTVVAVERMGENCDIIAAVTIGMRNEWAFPTIGNNVFIGAGARVLGKVTIGANARIGANAVVISDIPANSTAVGIPARPLREHDDRSNERKRQNGVIHPLPHPLNPFRE